jgi:hypothetical protein
MSVMHELRYSCRNIHTAAVRVPHVQTVSHIQLQSPSHKLGYSSEILPWWQPFFHVVAENGTDIDEHKKGTRYTECQNWCLGWARFYDCDCLVCKVEKQLSWIICTIYLHSLDSEKSIRVYFCQVSLIWMSKLPADCVLVVLGCNLIYNTDYPHCTHVLL